MPTRFYVWTVFVIVATVAARHNSPADLVGGLFFNGLLFVLPVYLYIQWRRRKRHTKDGG